MQQRWHVKHVEGFIKAQNRRKIKTLSAADINDYFGVIGRQNSLLVRRFGNILPPS